MTTLTFGVEIECFLPTGTTHAQAAAQITAAGVETSAELYNHYVRPTWKIVTDGSLGDYQRGAEIVSPILSGPEGFAALQTVCDALVAMGARVDRRCGLHVHVGARDRDLDFFKNLVALYGKYEETIDTLVSPSRRGSANLYCRAVTTTAGESVKRAKTMDELRQLYGAGNRYRKLNLEAYWRHGTVEFRQHQGTVEYRKIAAWVRLCLGLVNAATKTNEPTIRVLVSHNPKRPGSKWAAKFAQLRDGMTVAEVRRLGWRTHDLDWDVNHGYIAIVGDIEHTVDFDGFTKVVEMSEDDSTYFTARATRFSAVVAANNRSMAA